MPFVPKPTDTFVPGDQRLRTINPDTGKPWQTIEERDWLSTHTPVDRALHSDPRYLDAVQNHKDVRFKLDVPGREPQFIHVEANGKVTIANTSRVQSFARTAQTFVPGVTNFMQGVTAPVTAAGTAGNTGFPTVPETTLSDMAPDAFAKTLSNSASTAPVANRFMDTLDRGVNIARGMANQRAQDRGAQAEYDTTRVPSQNAQALQYANARTAAERMRMGQLASADMLSNFRTPTDPRAQKFLGPNGQLSGGEINPDTLQIMRDRAMKALQDGSDVPQMQTMPDRPGGGQTGTDRVLNTLSLGKSIWDAISGFF